MISLPASLRSSLSELGTRIPSRALAVLALTGAVSIWGTSAVATKAVLDHLPPVTLASVRWLIALAILLPLLRRSGATPARGRRMLFLGVTGLTLFHLCYNWGLRYTTAANGTLIHGGAPVLTALIAAAVLGERPTRRRALGVGASLLGVGVIVGVGNDEGLGFSLLGDLLVFVSAVSWAVYTVAGRRSFAGGNSLAIVAGSAIYGTALMLPIAAGEVAVEGAGPVTGQDALLLLFLGLGSSAAAYLLWGYGLTHLEASQVAVFANLLPPIGVVAAAVFLGEAITAVQLLGGAAIVVGVWLATSRKNAARTT